MCFGAPSNPPVMPPSPPLRTITKSEDMAVKLPSGETLTAMTKPYWNGKFRTDEEVEAIKELLVAVPEAPGIEMRHGWFESGPNGCGYSKIVDFYNFEVAGLPKANVDIPTPEMQAPRPGNERMSATKRRYADKTTGMLLTQNEAYQIRSDAKWYKMLSGVLVNKAPEAYRTSGIAVYDVPAVAPPPPPPSADHIAGYEEFVRDKMRGSNFGVGTQPTTPKPANAMPSRQPAMESDIVEH